MLDDEKNKSLSGTLEGTLEKTKLRNSVDAEIRRKVVKLQQKYKNPEFTKKVLYMVDGYDPETINTEMEYYNNIMNGEPLKQNDEKLNLENRHRQMLYNDIVSQIEAVDPNTGQGFDPNSAADKAALINDLATQYEDVSLDEIIGAVNERLPQGAENASESATEDNLASDFKFGTYDPRSENSLFDRTYGRVGRFAANNPFTDTIKSAIGDVTGSNYGVEAVPEIPAEQSQQEVKGIKEFLFPTKTETYHYPRFQAKMPDVGEIKVLRPKEKSTEAVGAPEKYKKTIEVAAQENNVPVGIMTNLLKHESSFDEDVINGKRKSSAGALGIAQFMPATAEARGVDPLNPDSAIRGAANYLRELYDKFGSWELALAAYNAGEGTVRKFKGVPPYKETQAYVKKILANT